MAEEFHPGSLNVGIRADGYPQGFASPETGGKGVTPLDDRVIEPTLVLPWNKIANNRLVPSQGNQKGDRSILARDSHIRDTGGNVDCW